MATDKCKKCKTYDNRFVLCEPFKKSALHGVLAHGRGIKVTGCSKYSKSKRAIIKEIESTENRLKKLEQKLKELIQEMYKTKELSTDVQEKIKGFIGRGITLSELNFLPYFIALRSGYELNIVKE